MRLADTAVAHSCAVSSAAASTPGTEQLTSVTRGEVRTMMLYLRKARERAIAIRDRSPGGSYLESVLTRTIDGISLELSQLDYLLASQPVDPSRNSSTRRMRPAI
ncbi:MULTISPECIES: hypothetical protein [Stappiaceae]|uniref:hypothetical protein n=1 Tax=Stappiaceae TaxID=2821832 RepID=UPI00078343A2|nr:MULTISPECIES: hypothetical protein [Stappiaceae]MEC9419125.1 hypothetical protein [Pseudomonadota bacterium]MBN8180185.1 hypothetical protein [Roseibium aggregatum]NKX62491.1 hypothetical protein [Labrenzia sp. 5N]UES45667.1 hypothetical protein GFK90_18845 [Roseibium aggregatum]UES56922.1 hypothetical protein GFK91_15665 [Roseibium aggregatum]